MNKIFNGRNIAIAIMTLALGTFVAFGAAKMVFNSTETITGNVVSFILNPEGKVDGAILDTGDQVKFGAETGEVVAANLQIGGQLSATGDAGTKSNYGCEFHAKSLQIGDQTITIAKPKGPKGPKDGGPKPPKDRERGPKGDKPAPPRDGEKPLPPNGEMNDEKPLPPDAEMNRENAPKPEIPAAETAKISGSVKFVLVNREGEPRGVILSNGEQFNLGKEVEDANLSFDQNTSVSVEGEIAKGQFGTFVRPKVLSIGNQTFTFGR